VAAVAAAKEQQRSVCRVRHGGVAAAGRHTTGHR